MFKTETKTYVKIDRVVKLLEQLTKEQGELSERVKEVEDTLENVLALVSAVVHAGDIDVDEVKAGVDMIKRMNGNPLHDLAPIAKG